MHSTCLGRVVHKFRLGSSSDGFRIGASKNCGLKSRSSTASFLSQLFGPFISSEHGYLDGGMGLWAGLQARALTRHCACLGNTGRCNSREPTAITFPDWQSRLWYRGITLGIYFPSRPSGAPLSHQPCDSSVRVRRRLASDALPCIEISSGILTVSSHHYAIGWFLKVIELPGRASLRDIRARDHAYPCVLGMPRHRLPPAQQNPGCFSAPGRRRGRLATRPKSLIPAKIISLPWASFPFSSISPCELPPACAPSCLPITDLFARAEAQGSPRARDAWHQPTPGWVRRGGSHLAHMGVD